MKPSIVWILSILKSLHNLAQAQAAKTCCQNYGWKWGRVRGVAIALLSLALVYISISSGTLWAATTTANSCSQANVQSAVNLALDNDTVLVPPGTCIWSTLVVLDQKTITLQGAGIGQTIIFDGTSKIASPPWYTTTMLAIRAKDGGLTRITGFTFNGGVGTGDPNNQSIVNVINGTTNNFRFDHNAVITTRTSGLSINGCVNGVIDHNTWTLVAGAYGMYTKNGNSCDGGDYGDGAWTRPANFGTSTFLFIEDNTFSADCAAFTAAVDGWSGMRVVFRHNSVNCTIGFTTHGTQQRQRGSRAVEAYANTFSRPTGFINGTAISVGSGAGLVYGNTVTGNFKHVGDWNDARIDIFYNTWGQCNGTSVWDGKMNSSGYPCIDQVGRGAGDLITGDPCCMVNTVTGTKAWPNQGLEPSYSWDNTLNGAADFMVSNHPTYIQLKREYFNNLMPGYVSYTYPHPLISASTANNPPPAPPTNVMVR